LPRKKTARLSEVHFYQWYVSRWLGSTAHDELDATGRGIYREMLDACYTQGSVTSDPEILCRKCACTREELNSRWPLIVKHFVKDGHTPERLRNKIADTVRASFFEHVSLQRANGALGGRRKPSDTNDMQSGGFLNGEPKGNPPLTFGESQERRKEKGERRKEKKESAELPTLADRFHEWIALYPNATKIETACRAWLSLIDSGEITDDTIAEVFAGLERYKRSTAWAKDGGRWICEPTTFLIGNDKNHGRMWRDNPQPLEPEEKPKRSSRGIDPEAEWVPPWRE